MLGRDLVPLLAADHEVTAVDMDVDITDPKAVDACVADCRPEAVFHLAAWTDVDAAEEREVDALVVNGVGTANVARAAERVGAALVVVSTDYVFDGTASPYDEDAPVAPIGAYGRTKLAGEEAALAEHPKGTRIARTAWLYGAHGRNFVDTMRRLGAERDEVTVVADQEGCPTWTRDLAPALVALLDQPPGIYHTVGDGFGHLGGLRRGDLCGGRPGLPGVAGHDSGVWSSGPATCTLRLDCHQTRSATPATLARSARRLSEGVRMRLLVTGGCGFIGSAFVRIALGRGAEVVNLDKLTYAGNPANVAEVADEPGIQLHPGGHRRPGRRRRGHRGLRRRRQLRGREPRRSQHPGSRRVHPHGRAGHRHAAGRSSRGRRRTVRAGLDRRGLRLDRLRVVPRDRSAAAVQPVLGEQGGRRPAGARVASHLSGSTRSSHGAATRSGRVSTPRSSSRSS